MGLGLTYTKRAGFQPGTHSIDISSSADADWKIDIKKSRASLPVYLRERVRSALKIARQDRLRYLIQEGLY